ncbi:MAG: sulfatase-like hydrolase/transferase [Bacteroidales bacterium]|jgi:arylsulfatase A-like enzyme|nr:sulfatase-like hydrolase/transferase [Bacteroidales bacterium]
MKKSIVVHLQFVTIAILILLFTGCQSEEVQEQPNIIFIMTDDQSSIVPTKEDGEFKFSDGNGRGIQSHPFGFCGDTAVHTPIIDELAANGMIFTRAYVSSSVCSPSRYSTLTGRYAGRCEGNSFLRLHPEGEMTRVENNTELEESRENLPRLLQKAGYLTGFVGKSHIVDHHLLGKNNWEKNGLMTYSQDADPKEISVSEAMGHNHQFWVDRIKKYGFDYANGIYAANLKELHNDSLNVHNVEWKNKAALEFIDQAGDGPFFLYYSETVPHGPAPWINQNGKYVYGLDANPQFTSKGYVEDPFLNMTDRAKILEEVIQAGKDPDHAWLTWFDHAVGSVISKLEEKGILENTLIVVCSDHGNYNYGKSTIYEGGVKIPLMMYFPKGIKSGSSYDELVQNIDFAPTFLELAGVDLSSVDEMDGTSLKQPLSGNTDPVHDNLFFEIGFARGVMTKDWKYISVRYDENAHKQIEEDHTFTGWNGHTFKRPYYIRNTHLGYHSVLMNPNYFDPDQLYDMKNDPQEKQNLFEENSEKSEEMKQKLIEKLSSFPGRPFGELVK